ncbi:MAG: thioredoxin family protein [Puniceicoccales bacterium]|jgi:thiol:disulfide interchange protein/DsbC/DsbD-like thiol-disulfide interchange protein|nr:thioredoxin family protein [Puniceicoccales bacterium]
MHFARHIFSLFTLFAFLLPLHGQSAGAPAKTKASLVADHSAITPGQKLLIGIRLVSQPHWHTYWKNPGDAGSVTEMKWEKLQGASMGEWQWPAPKLFVQGATEDFPGLYNFVYEGDTTILIPLTIAPDAKVGEKIVLKGEVSWLECDDSNCVPQSSTISLTLPIEAKAIPANAELFTKAKADIPLATDAWQITAVREGTNIILRLKPNGADANDAIEGIHFFPSDQQIPPSAQPKVLTEGKTKVYVFDAKDSYEKEGTVLTGVLTAKNSWLKSAPDTKAISVGATYGSQPATSIKATDTTQAAVSAKPASGVLTWEDWTLARQEELLAAGKLIYIDFTARWCATCQVNKRVYSNEAIEEAFHKNEVVLLRADWTKKNAEIANELAKYQRAAVPFNVFLKKDHPAVPLPELLTVNNVLEKLDVILGKRADDAPLEQKEESSLPAQIALALVGGLILNLMPCVFPVLGLKIMGFVGQAGQNRRKVVIHGIVFAIGVLLSFWILATVLLVLRQGGSQLGWGFQLQEPGFVLAMAVVLLVFALNMAGLFEIGGRAVGVGSGLTAKSGYGGSFFSGILATIIATPCAAPFLAPALGAALALPPVPSYLIFTAIAVGLALPYLLLSAFPDLIKMLPRPGAWMESFKQGLSFLLFATVLYLLWVLAGQMDIFSLRDVFLGMAAIAFACWVYGRWSAPHREAKTRLIGMAVSAVILLGTCIYYYTLIRAENAG